MIVTLKDLKVGDCFCGRNENNESIGIYEVTDKKDGNGNIMCLRFFGSVDLDKRPLFSLPPDTICKKIG